MEAAMDLMRRISPKESETALSALMSLIPHHSADLLSQVDLPLQYYEGGVSSVYIWDDDSQGFVACFLIKKDGSRTADGKRGYLQEGSWDAIHVIEVGLEEEGRAHYCLTSTVMLSLTTENKSSGTFNLSGSIRRQMALDLPIAEGHLCNMGKMIEEMEGKLRNSLDQVYFGKTREMVCTLRPPPEGVQLRLP